MQSTDKRVAAVRSRMATETARRQARTRNAWMLLSVGVLAALVVLVRANGVQAAPHQVPGLVATTLLVGGAGGYVLVALVSFALAVVVTVICLKHRDQREEAGARRKRTHRDRPNDRGEGHVA